MPQRDWRGGVEVLAEVEDMQDPVRFLEKFVIDRKGRPIHLYEYQRKYIANRPKPLFNEKGIFQHWTEDSKSRMVVKARQIGMSYVSALEAMWLCMTVPGILVMFISIKQDQAEELLSHTIMAWNSIPDRIVTPAGVFTKMKTTTTREQMTFYHPRGLQSRIISLPNSPGAARGWAADLVYWDEAAKFPHEQEMLAALLPTTARGGLVTRLSTHRGTTTNFYEESVKCKRDAEKMARGIFTDLEMPDMSYQETHYLECPDPEYQKTVEKLKKRFGENSFFFQEEFCCIASDESVAMFTHADLRACQDLWEKKECKLGANPDGTHKIVVGLDIGRVKDVTVLYAIEDLGEYAPIIRIKEWAGQGFDAQLALVSHELESLGKFYLRVDHTGMGMMMAEKLGQIFGSRVEGIDFTLPQKDALITEAYVQVKDHRIAMPPDEDNMGFKLYNQLHNVRRERSEKSFNAKYVQSEGTLPDDHLWAFCLAASQLTSPAPIQGTLLMGKKDTVIITEQSGKFEQKITPHKTAQVAVQQTQTPTVRIMTKPELIKEDKDKLPEREYWRSNLWDAPKRIPHNQFEKTSCTGTLEWQGKLGQADQYVCDKCFCNAIRTRRK